MSERDDKQRGGSVSATDEGVEPAAAGRRPTVVRVGQGEQAPEPEPTPEERPKPAPRVEVETDGDFAALLAEQEAGGDQPDGFRPGDKVEGVVEVVSLHGDEVFLDLGGKVTGYVLKEELRDLEGHLTVEQGDRLEGVVAGMDANGVRVRTSVGRGVRDREAIIEAYEAGLPVEGKVVDVNKGGFEVEAAGGRAFCPMSHMDLFRPPEPQEYVGRTLTFKVLELREGSPVLSRAELLREQRAEQAAELRERLVPGARLPGVVRSIQKFGAFVDLGGVDGLVHTSELSWGHVDDPHEVVSLGQEVEVVVLEVDEDRDRVGLSIARAQGDPFEDAMQAIQVGSVVDGTIVRLTNFGAFVNLAPHVDGMIHVSDMAHHHVRHPKEVVSKGDHVRVKVTGIDLGQRRIGLSLKDLSDDPWDSAEERYSPGTVVKGTVARIAQFGVFIDLEPGVTGLLHASESGVPQGQPLQSAYKPGSEVEVRILRVDSDERKIGLTVKDESERAAKPRPRGGGPRRGSPRGGGQPKVWRDREAQEPAGDKGLGTLGEKLMKALEKDD
ncbi:MAG: S1 RNA-binding domain-containing protein [Myxococcota bacterium]